MSIYLIPLTFIQFSYSCGECHRRKQKVRSNSYPLADPHITTVPSSVIARFPAPTYASVHRLNTAEALNYVFSVWLVRSLSCVKHTPRASQTKISTYVSLALSISLRLHCQSLHLDLALPLRIDGLWSVRSHILPVPIQVHIHNQKRMTLAAGLFKVGGGTELVHLGVSHQLQCYSR